MFRIFKTKRIVSQNEMFFFRVPSPRKNASDFSGAFLFSRLHKVIKRSDETARPLRRQGACACVLCCSRICVRCRGSTLSISTEDLSVAPLDRGGICQLAVQGSHRYSAGKHSAPIRHRLSGTARGSDTELDCSPLQSNRETAHNFCCSASLGLSWQ